MQPLHVSGTQVSVSGTPSGAWSHLLDPSKLYALPDSITANGASANIWAIDMLAPVTTTVQTTTTTTITLTVAINAAEAGSVYTPYAGRASLPGAYMACPVQGAAEYQYPTNSMLIDLTEVRPEAWAGHGSQRADSRDWNGLGQL